MTQSSNDYSLREKKFARTKIALMNEFIKRLENTKFNNISIKDVCDSVEVSEATFHNYFPQKTDLICYFKQLITLKIIWIVKKRSVNLDEIDRINLLFSTIADEMPNKNIFYELISVFTGERIKNQKEEVSTLEKIFAFPDCEGIADIPNIMFEDFFLECLEKALVKNKISASIKPETIVLGLTSIMIGMPLAIQEEEFDKIERFYKEQLKIFWKGLGIEQVGQ